MPPLRQIGSIACFLTFLLVVHLALRFAFIETLLNPEFPVERDRDYHKQEDVRLLFVGNSHVLFDIAPVEHSYNLASLNESYMVTYYRLRSILDHDPKNIRAVLVQVSNHSFRALRPIDFQQLYWAQLIDYTDAMRVTGEPWRSFRDQFRYQWFPYLGGTDRLIEWANVEEDAVIDTAVNRLGRDFANVQNPEQVSRITARRLIRNVSPVSPVAQGYLRRIIQLCDSHGIHVFLVRFPIPRVYYTEIAALVPPEDWQQAVDTAILGAGNVTFCDFVDLYFDDDSKFMDPLHLAARSGAAFTEVVLSELSKAEIEGLEGLSLKPLDSNSGD